MATHECEHCDGNVPAGTDFEDVIFRDLKESSDKDAKSEKRSEFLPKVVNAMK
jgi:hypothetical protein